MSSMRRLRRRLLRWNRYADKTYWNPRVTRPSSLGRNPVVASGHWRAWDAWATADEDRRCRAALIADVYDPRCCLAGELGHDGPCVIRCEGCRGDGRCPECGGVDDMGCWHCDGTGGCPRHCDDGEIVLQEWFS